VHALTYKEVDVNTLPCVLNPLQLARKELLSACSHSTPSSGIVRKSLVSRVCLSPVVLGCIMHGLSSDLDLQHGSRSKRHNHVQTLIPARVVTGPLMSLNDYCSCERGGVDAKGVV